MEGLNGTTQVWPPTREELPRLHRELGLWMAHTRYRLVPPEQAPVWRVQNTSFTLSTGSGIGTFYLLKRLNPALKFPWDLFPPFIIFYLTHSAAHVWQLPGLYESFLGLSTPLGVRTREVLEALRTGGRLPSHEFGTQLPPLRPPGQQRGASETPVGEAGAFGQATSVEDDATRTGQPGWTHDASTSSGWTPDASTPGGEPNETAPPPLGWAGGGLPEGGGWGTTQEEQAAGKTPPPRRSWDEIRARAATAEQQAAKQQ